MIALVAPVEPPTDAWGALLADRWMLENVPAEVLLDVEQRRGAPVMERGDDPRLAAYSLALDILGIAQAEMMRCDAAGDGTAVLRWRCIRNDAARTAERLRGSL